MTTMKKPNRSEINAREIELEVCEIFSFVCRITFVQPVAFKTNRPIFVDICLLSYFGDSLGLT